MDVNQLSLKDEYETISNLFHAVLLQNKQLQSLQKQTTEFLQSSLQHYQANSAELYYTTNAYSSNVEQYYECYQDMSFYVEGRKQQVQEFLQPPTTSSAPEQHIDNPSKPNTRARSAKKKASSNKKSHANNSKKRTNQDITLNETEIELAKALTEKKRKMME